MGKTLTMKLLESHLLEGKLLVGEDVKVKVDQTLTQDSTGTMVYLQLLALNIAKIKTECSVAYIDHNMLQAGFENADDHEFIRSVANRYGIIYSKAGNGICHQLHLERFSKPGKVLIGSDSHTPTCGAVCMLAIGAGGLDVAVGMSHGFYTIKVPKVMNIQLTGSLKPWVSAKDVILYILKLLTVKGGVGYILEYSGEGLNYLSVTDRATIANMGAEVGATTSIFPSDEVTLDYFKGQGRPEDYAPLTADFEANEDRRYFYDEVLKINLDEIEPLTAMPHSPDQVRDVKDITGLKIDQVAIGSCTNSSYKDLMRVAQILKGKKVAEHVSLVISPGSSNILKMLADNGALGDLIASGARILEASCGPCIGMGQAPKSGGVSLRTFNRNFRGRCGTDSASVYLVSPETAAISAIYGVLTSPEALANDQSVLDVVLPSHFEIQNGYFIHPNGIGEIITGPNIKPFPLNAPLMDVIIGEVILKTGDHITTDDIVPSSAKLLPLRSNVPELSKHCFEGIDVEFYNRAIEKKGGFIVGGDNYGQGSSREHAALVPLYLGVKAVIAKSFARIHKANLINSGILPLVFANIEAYQSIELGDVLTVEQLDHISDDEFLNGIRVQNLTKETTIIVKLDGSIQDVALIKIGGQINHLKQLAREV
ncbi:aconitate hydratase [Fusibacter bizertensis]